MRSTRASSEEAIVSVGKQRRKMRKMRPGKGIFFVFAAALLMMIGIAEASNCGDGSQHCRQHGQFKPWNLPSPTSLPARGPYRQYMDECTSVVDLLSRLRGGADDYRDYNDDDYYNDDRGVDHGRSSSIPNVLRTGDKKLGTMVVGAGVAITVLGISLFFNKTLLRLGNLMLMAGMTLFFGPAQMIGFFKSRMRSSACLAVGVFLVFIGWPILGMACEVFGILNLFGNMFPIVKIFAKQFVPKNMGNLGGMASNKNQSEDRHDDYYYDGRDEQRKDGDDDRYRQDYGYPDDNDYYSRRDNNDERTYY